MTVKQITIHLPIELKDKLQQEANNKGYTIKDLIVFILNQYFQSIEQE